MNRVIFLDRDGTINVDHGFVYAVNQWQFTERAPEALKRLQDEGFKLAIITNQSGIAYDYYTENDMHALHEYMREELKKNGVAIDAIAYCPHDRSGDCECRKPKTGMAGQIEQQIGQINYRMSWTIGDKTADAQFGRKLNTHTALIRSKYWEEKELAEKPELIVDSLWEFAGTINPN